MRPLHWASMFFALHLCGAAGAQNTIPFLQNRGQWPDAVTHRAELSSGTVWIERSAILVDRYDQRTMDAIVHAHTHGGETAPTTLAHHALRLRFDGTRPDPRIEAVGVRPGTYHFLLGNDPTKWARNVHAFGAVVQHDIYAGIDLRIRTGDAGVKYDVIVNPGADPRTVRFHYEGADTVNCTRDRIIVKTSLGMLNETIPLAYQEVDGQRRIIACTYRTIGDAIGFNVGDYDRSLPLVIDPTLIFSTYSGSTANNFGYTATFDRDGFLYSGSSAFGQGYPLTTGAYQMTHAGGNGLFFGIDMALTKYDTSGTELIWSTYLGGASDELPHSLIVNGNDELFVYGTTSSADFPTSTAAYDRTFNGGPPVSLLNGVGANFPNGTDIVVARLSPDGGDLLAGTFLGGSGTDGLNTASGLKFNYADEIRGEVLLDANDNVYIASSTASTDFPVTPAAAQSTYGGGVQDGVLLKMDASLTTLIWSTYFGGSQADAVYNIELDDDRGLFIAGGTRSADLPVTPNALHPTYLGGTADGFVAELHTNGTTVMGCTYFGSAAYDQCYFADLDQNGDIYLFGQTAAPANELIHNAPYNTPNSGQFISKLDPDLSTVLISTRFGQGDGRPDISPTAFLVDYCNKIYVSGWGSSIQGGTLSTAGMPVTPNAYQLSTDSNDLYLAVFEIDLSSLYYATYFGGGISDEHVDGGTSRFDRRGRVYQSVCAGCGGHSDLPIEPADAWSPTNNSGACNNAVFKFDMDIPMVVADFTNTVSCLPAPITFNNNSSGASSYQWSFGDNTTSNAHSPSHTYASPGVYTVQLVAHNAATCNVNDTTTRQVVVLGAGSYALPDTILCPGNSAQIGLLPITAPGITYQWSPTTGLNNAMVPNPIATPAISTTYSLTISNGVCSTTAEQTVALNNAALDAGPDRIICGPTATVTLTADGSGVVNMFQWSSSNMFNDMLNASPADSTAQVQLDQAAWFYVRQIGAPCPVMDSVFIDLDLVDIGLAPVEAICLYDTGFVNLLGNTEGYTIAWAPDELIAAGQGTHQIRTHAPTTTTFFVVVTTTNGCTWSGSVQQVVSPLDASTIYATATPTILIGGGTVQLEAFPPDLSYSWSPLPLSDPTIADPTATIQTTTLFSVDVSDGICNKNARVLVEVRELRCEGPDIFVPNTFTPNGDGANDLLFVRGRNIRSLEFMVFDRWGEKVFETTDITRGWDGMYNGQPVDPAVFVYHLNAYCVDGQHYFTKGNVTVVR